MKSPIERFADTMIEAFLTYQREYLRKSEEEAVDELEKFMYCRELVTNNK